MERDGERGFQNSIDEDAVVSVVFPSLRDAVFGLSKRDRDKVKERGRDRGRDADSDSDSDSDGDGDGEKEGEEKNNIIEIGRRWENSEISLSPKTSLLSQRILTDEYVHYSFLLLLFLHLHLHQYHYHYRHLYLCLYLSL